MNSTRCWPLNHWVLLILATTRAQLSTWRASQLSPRGSMYMVNKHLAGKFKFVLFFLCSPTCFSAIQFRHDFLLRLFSVLCTDYRGSNPRALRVDPRGHARQFQLAQRRPISSTTFFNFSITSDHLYRRWLFQPPDYFQTRERPCRKLFLHSLKRGWLWPLHCQPRRPRWL